MRSWLLALCLVAATAAVAEDEAKPKKADAPAAKGKGWTEKVKTAKELYATLETTEGKIVVRLFHKDAPKTVENFLGLATGEKEWVDPSTGMKTRRPLYTDVKFH